MRDPVVVAARAKINLLLHVGGKRADGYHELESFVAFVLFGDEISLYHGDGFSLTLSGPFAAQLPDAQNNSALRAANLLAERIGTTRGARICLEKNLPIASGLGGGSADAAAVLRGLTGLWQLELGTNALLDTAVSLGADVPVCFAGVTSWMEGKGDRLRPLPPLPKAGVLLVNPGVQISTAEVFAALSQRRGIGLKSPDRAFDDVYELVQYLRHSSNDLEGPARKIEPVVTDVLREMDELPHALVARMSGSGATCFALFADDKKARSAGCVLRNRHPEWWIRETVFRDR